MSSDLHVYKEGVVQFLFRLYSLILTALKMFIKFNDENVFKHEKQKLGLTFIPGLALAGFRTTKRRCINKLLVSYTDRPFARHVRWGGVRDEIKEGMCRIRG